MRSLTVSFYFVEDNKYYPACLDSTRFAKLTNKSYLTSEELKQIEKLSYEIRYLLRDQTKYENPEEYVGLLVPSHINLNKL